VRWLEQTALHDVVWDRDVTQGSGLVRRDGAPPLWARLYEIGTGRPIFGERDRTVHYAVSRLGNERRRGYAWYVTGPAEALTAFKSWRR
jgi:PelA/Pel-15E family pectate lyase